MPLIPEVTGFYDPRTGSVQYVVADPATSKCAIIDPVLDYDEKSGSIDTTHADELLAFVAERGYALEWILDTHPHADHFSAADYLKRHTGAPIAIGEHIVDVQKLWKSLYNLPDQRTDGAQCGGRTLLDGKAHRRFPTRLRSCQSRFPGTDQRPDYGT